MIDIPNHPSEDPEFESKDVYLSKDSQLIGIHSIGWTNPDGSWYSFETWGNEYDSNYKMVGRGSFRVHSSLDDAVQDLLLDGWQIHTKVDKT